MEEHEIIVPRRARYYTAGDPHTADEIWVVLHGYGQLADEFLRLYVTPGADHVGAGAPSSVDMLRVLIGWVERGEAPGDLVQAAHEANPPYAVTATRPMCRYPAFPRYRGGDAAQAQSFECVRP